jgi:hypothetical protein
LKFESLKKLHGEEKRRVEDGRKKLEDDRAEFLRLKTLYSQLLTDKQLTHHSSSSGLHTLTLGKNKKK